MQRVSKLVRSDEVARSSRVVFEQRGDLFRAEVTTASGQVRVLEGPDCGELARAVALILSLNVEAVTVLRVEPKQTFAADSSNQSQIWIAVEGLMRNGLMPSLAGRFRFEVSLFWQSARIQLGFSSGVSESSLGKPRSNAGAVLWAPIAGDLSACVGWSVGRFDFYPCWGAEVGVFSATGVGVVRTTSGTAGWVTGHLKANVGFRFTETLGLRIQGLGGVNVTRPRVVIEGIPEVYRMPLWTYGAAISVVWRVF